ncbi:MAG TPA: hypothetical protein VF809_03435 [Candidatus Saccharimonadales bacterium]
MVERYPHLIDPEALKGPMAARAFGWLAGHNPEAVANTLNTVAADMATAYLRDVPAGVIIQARRAVGCRAKHTKPAPQIEAVIATAENIRAQKYHDVSRVAIAAAVDYPDFCPDLDQTNRLSDLRVRILHESPRSNAPRAMNNAARWMMEREGMVVMMDAGNRFATDWGLATAAYHINDGAIGVYGPRVMDRNASLTGILALNGGASYFEQYAEVDLVPFASENGFMSAAGVALNVALLHDYPLDETYGRGDAARQWVAGFNEVPGDAVYNPAMAVHDHSGVSFRQLLEEASMLEPTVWPVADTV